MRCNSTGKMTAVDAETALRALLGEGSRCSRGVMEMMRAQGWSPKQTRRVRERLGVVVQREGSRRAARSIWSLPGEPRQQEREAEYVPAIAIPHRDPLQRSRQIATMPHDELRDYARQIGVRQRDIDDLSLDRLRQNCMLTVARLVEAYME